MYARLQLVERRLARNDLEPALVHRDVTLVRQAADRLKTLIDRLLDISRIASGSLQLDREVTDVAEMVRSTALMLAETSGREITVMAPDPPESYRMAVDGVRLDEVVVNLIENAVKYSPGGTAIDVELTSSSAALRIGVRDHGPGIKLADRARIFEPFHRSSNNSVPGVGLGLHIAKQIVELHGGTLTVEAPADGGSRFVVNMPRNSEDGLGDVGSGNHR
jgi:two-component system sensor histidine kinase KdpD